MPCLTVFATAHGKSSPLPLCSPNNSETIAAAAKQFVFPVLRVHNSRSGSQGGAFTFRSKLSLRFVPSGHITSCFNKALTCDRQHGCPHQCWQHCPVTLVPSHRLTSAHSWPLASPLLTSHVLSGPRPCLLRVLILLA